MTPLAERFELRLSSHLLDLIDDWREDRENPSRAEAIRQLVELGLNTSDKQSYAIMKFQLLTAFKRDHLDKEGLPVVLRDYLPGTIFCWKRDIYPLFDGEYALPFANQFEVTRSMIDSLHNLLWNLWDAKKTITYYELEGQLDAKKRHSEWRRYMLIQSCRYLHDHGECDADFWKAMLSHGPIESDVITVRIDDDEAINGSKKMLKYDR